MAISRVIYTNSDLHLKALTDAMSGSTDGGGELEAQPNTVQNATFTLTIPRADVNSLGFKGVIGRPQLEASSATIEFSWIPLITPATTGNLDEDTNDLVLTEIDLNDLMLDCLDNSPVYVGVDAHNVGQITSALMTSLSGDASVGALPTFTASFLGKNGGQIGANQEGAGGSTKQETYTEASGVDVGITEPDDISVLGGPQHDQEQGCVQTGSFTWDMPVELVLCLGDDPSDDGEALSSPPGTASITVEGLGEVEDAKKVTKLKIGEYAFSLGAHAEIDSRTSNMAVGELFGTFNYVVGSTADSCSMA